MLEEQSRAANEVLYKKKKSLAQLEKELEEDTRRAEEAQTNVERMDGAVREWMGQKEVLDRDLEEQAGRADRAQRTAEQRRQEAQSAGVHLAEDSAAMMEIDLANAKEETNSILYALGSALQEHPDALPLFQSLCDDKGMMVPSRPASASRSRPGSATSGRGQGRAPPRVDVGGNL